MAQQQQASPAARRFSTASFSGNWEQIPINAAAEDVFCIAYLP
jgi:hypothetical protein